MQDILGILKRRTDYYLEKLRKEEGLSRTFKGIWIPKEIWETTGLSISEKVLLAEIESLDNGKGCFASNKYLSHFLGVSEREVQRKISRLIKLGLITWVESNGRKRWLKSRVFICVGSKGFVENSE